MRRLCGFGLGVVLAGCPAGDDGKAGDSGVDGDSGADSGSDSGVDSGADSGPDSGSDSGADSGADSGGDSGSDSGADSGGDSGADSGSDSGADSGADSGTTGREVCNGVDDDGDGLVDDEDPDLDDGAEVWTDADGDGYGDPASLHRTCDRGDDDVDNGDDCDDTHAECNPDRVTAGYACEAVVDCDCTGGVDHTCNWYDLPEIDHGASGSYLGTDLEAGVDVTGDGVPDLVAGAPQYDGASSNEGEVAVYAGPVGAGSPVVATINSGEAGAWLGGSVAIGDLDGDGVGDVAYLGPEASGGAALSNRVFVSYGPLSGGSNMDDAGWTLSSSTTYAGIGYALDVGGDLDGDTFEDLVVGDPSYGEGAIYVYDAGTPGDLDVGDYLAGVYTNRSGAEVGTDVVTGRDFDGDGQSDLVVGAPGVDSGVGEVRVFFGPLSGLQTWGSADYRVAGVAGDHDFGGSVWGLDDLDGDGLPELFVGRDAGSPILSPTGAADIVATDAKLQILPAEHRSYSAFKYPAYGSAVSADLDGDGALDVFVGNSGTDADYFGFAAVLLGPVSSGVLLSDADLSWRGFYNYEGMGDQNRLLGDQDGDGHAEVVTTNYTYGGSGYLLFFDGREVR